MAKPKTDYETMRVAPCYFFAANYILGGGRGHLPGDNLLFLSKDELALRATRVVGRIGDEHRDRTILRFGAWVMDESSECPSDERDLFVKILCEEMYRSGVPGFVDVSAGIAATPQRAWRAPGVPPIGKPHPDYKDGAAFYASNAWRQLRYMFLRNSQGKCECCGATAGHGAVLHVDHIVPRWKDPSRELDIGNLQCLCAGCNLGKGAWDSTDWRTCLTV